MEKRYNIGKTQLIIENKAWKVIGIKGKDKYWVHIIITNKALSSIR